MRPASRPWLRPLALALLALAAASAARATILQGKLVLPSYGPVVNGILTLALSQAAVVPGSYAIAPATVACYTSTDGSVVGVPNPAATPTGGAFGGTGTLPAGTYFVEIVYQAAGSTATLASPEARFVLTSAGYLLVNAPALSPAAATGYAVYIGTASGTETLQGTAALGSGYTQSTPLTAGAAPPGSNSTACSVMGNDTLIPAYTYYSATLADANGNVLAGFPQNWYIAGSPVDVSELEPLASNPAVRFPMPILANPSSAQAQSLGSGLNLNGYTVTGSGNVGPGFFSAYWSGTLPAPTSALATWTPNSAVQVRRLDMNAQSAGSGGSAGLTITVSDGTSTCTFAGMLPAAGTSSSAAPSGACGFNAGVPLTVSVTGDDHGTRPGNVSWSLEVTSR